MIDIYKPSLDDLWFRQTLMADENTMSYNIVWGGTIAFPKEKWDNWYKTWVDGDEFYHYYRYLLDKDKNVFVGEVAYHYDNDRNIHLCDVIVFDKYRYHGFGSQGLLLLCMAAKENGILVLYDEIASDNLSYSIFLKNGFVVDYQDSNVIMVKKVLT
ncbi:MAG: GNAT family N-acetyltransferase [Erysipelotrichaceae bacterium]